MLSVRNAIRHLVLLPAVILTASCQSVPERADTSADFAAISTEYQPITHSAKHAYRATEDAFYPASEEPRLITRLRLSEQSALFTTPADQQAQAPADLWERLLSGYQLSIPDNERVENELQWFTTSSNYLTQVQERARPYFHFILEEVEKRELPAELALLPVVESGFRPFAYSPGHAAGLWQFIPSTGRMYGLKQDWWYDGRRDVVASTRAALDYLQALNQRFDGDWELALAAYNAGAGNVQRAIEKNRRLGKATDFWSLDLPRETQNYVPRLLALARLFAESEDFGIQLQAIPNEPYFSIVDLDTQVDLSLAAEMAEIPLEELYRLNAGFNRWATSPDGPHRLQLPVDKAELFERRLATLERDERLTWERYQIKQGDNLGAIARRYGTTVAVLQDINKLKDARIRAGKHLLIPVSSQPSRPANQYAHRSRTPGKPKDPTGTRLVHRVATGDTLWDLAKRYGVTHHELARWNHIRPQDTLRLGQELVVWSKGEQLAVVNLPQLPADLRIGASEIRNSLRYRVRKGDSLDAIARRFNVSVAELKQWNTLEDPYLQPGQKLTLYLDVTEQTL